MFEAHPLIVSELKQRVERSEESAPVSLNGAERETRLEAQKLRLEGLSFQGEEEVAHDAYNLVYAMIQKDDLVWLLPEKFGTRRAEISAKKQGRELIIDGTGIAIKEKPTTIVCSLATELDVVMALRRRALAFDLIGVAPFNVISTSSTRPSRKGCRSPRHRGTPRCPCNNSLEQIVPRFSEPRN